MGDSVAGSRARFAGALSGLVGLAVFLSIHHFWIMPIWFIAPAGIVVAPATGVAAGWAYQVHAGRMPRSLPLRAAMVFAVTALILSPAFPIAVMLAPVDLVQRSMDNTRGATAFLLFFVIAVGIGAALGAILDRSRRGAGVTALAALGLAMGIGHNAPLFGEGEPAFKLWTIMLCVAATAAVTLVSLDALLSPRRAGGRARSDRSGGLPMHH